MRRFRYLGGICLPAILILALLAVPMFLSAQDLTTSANITGVVTDSSGAVVSKAVVTVTGVENGISRTLKTDAAGRYTVTLLPPGTYKLHIESKGFKSYEQTSITLLPEQSAKQDVQLSIGAETEEVVVTSQAPLLNTGDANLSAEISSQQVVDLPLNLRNVYGLATLNSSVQNSTESQQLNEGGTSGKADQDISFLNFGGGFFGTTSYKLDGIWDTDSTWGAVIYVPSVEAVADFKIQTNSFTAQNGFSTGNAINVETKSGTRDFHGDAFEFIRNSKLDANNWFNNHNGAAKPNFRRNQFGASAGGPIYIPGLLRQRDKAFIFGVYEGLRQSSPASGTFTVPTTRMHSGDFSELLTTTNLGSDALGLPILSGQIYNPNTGRVLSNGTVDTKTGRLVACPGNAATCNYRDPIANNNLAAIPGLINPVGAALLKYYPTPTSTALSNNYFVAAAAPTSSDEYLIRGDYNITDATRIYVRWASKHEQKTNSPAYYDKGYGGNDPGGPGNIRPNNRYSIVTGFSHVFNATTALSANAGFHRWNQGGLYQGYPFDQTTLGLPAGLNASSPEFPIINSSNGESSLGPVQGGFGAGIANVGSVSSDVTKVIKNHNLSFGFIDVVLQNNGNGPANTTFGFSQGYTANLIDSQGNTTNKTGDGFATLLLGFPSASSTATSNAFHTAPEEHYWGFYGQDDWKATKNLTVNLGLRWEFQQPWTERHNRQAFFDYSATNPISNAVGLSLPGEEVYSGDGTRRGLYKTNLSNLSPRIGFADQIAPKFVVRGGYGIFFPPASFVGIQASPGYLQYTPIVGSPDGGVTPGASLINPFPNGLIAPTGNALGALTDVGYSASTGVPANRHSPYVQQYSLGVQYAFTHNDVITATYVGNRGTHMLTDSVSRSQVNPALVVLGNNLSTKVANPFYGAIKSSACHLADQTIQLGQLLQPYPQYCGVSESQAPEGDSFYNALLVDYNHRFNNGLNVLVSYTFSKFLDDTGGTADWAYVGDSSGGYRNNYDLKMDKSLDGSDIKHSLVVNYVYQLPVGRGRKFASNINRATDAVIGGWQISGITSMKSGIPLSLHGGTTTSWLAGQHPDEVGNPRLANRGVNEWFNTAAFVTSPLYTYGNVTRYQSDVRAPGFYEWDASLQKYWDLPGEKMRLQGRAEFFNLPNHANFFAPDTGVTDGNYGQISSAFDARSIQFGLKLLW
jgi:hypothetical protein